MIDLQQRIKALSPAKQAILKQRLQETKAASGGIPRRDASLSAPLSFAQERLCFLDQLEPGGCAYNIPQAYWLRGPLNTNALEASFRKIIERHEILRSTIVWQEGFPIQNINLSSDFDLPIVRLLELSAANQQAELRRLEGDWIGTPFDLATGPLLRGQLIQTAAEVHLLLLNAHHVVFDGWSQAVLMGELSSIYSAMVSQTEPGVTELPIQYADYATWQRAGLSGEVLERQLAYWRQKLTGVAPLALPTDCVRPLQQTYVGARFDFALPAEVAGALRKFNQRNSVTPFMSLFAAFQVLMMRFSGQREMVIGTPIANRQHADLEPLIGFFVNMLAIRGDLADTLSFKEVVKQVHDTALEAYQHQDLPFEKLVEGLRVPRDPSRHPVFQVIFALQNTAAPTLNLAGLKATPHLLPSQTTHFDLELHLQPEGENLVGAFYYNTDLFYRGTIERLAACFQVLLAGALAEPERPIAELPLLTATDRQQLLVEWNNTATEYPRDKCIHQLFEEQVLRTPEAVAVVFENQRVTYRELNERANRLAHRLRELGVGPEMLVGICTERSVTLVVGLLAILKAGGAYVPLDPTHPPARLSLILEDAQPQVLLTQERLRNLFGNAAQSQLLCLDGTETDAENFSPENPQRLITSENLAYVIYTSGSTGNPKGVEIKHRSVVNFLSSMLKVPGLSARDTLLAVTTPSFDIAALELFLPLTLGARIVIAQQKVLADGRLLADLISEAGITVMQATPATWRLLLLTGWKGVPNLRILCGGEAWDQSLAVQLLAKCQSLWNMYGPTETTIWSTVIQIDHRLDMVIGRPIANTRLYVLDAYHQPAPIGVSGELCIGGDGLARGYLKRPELTAERFIPDPFSNEPGSRLYRTGDLARYRPDGNLEFLGRLDHQVKIRGFRIELGEVEAVLSRHPDLADAVAVAREDQLGEKFLVAYFVSRQSPGPTVAELREFLAKALPDYMLPTAFVSLREFPLTPNGKVDRRALPAPDTEVTTGVEHIAPRTEVERRLVAIWEEVLGVKNISIKDNLFDLGGHSLLAVRLIGKINHLLQLDLPLLSLFQTPTVEGLANTLQARKEAPQQHGLVSLREGRLDTELFFIDFQGGLSLFHLARALNADVPVHASVAPLPRLATLPAAEQSVVLQSKIEHLAGAHAELIRKHLQGRPCLVAGHCFGGILAFEVAQQLQRSGTTVKGVLMLDTWMTSPSRGWLFKAWLRAHILNTLRQGPRYLWPKLRRWLELGWQNWARHNPAAEHDPAIDLIYERALQAYRPQMLACRGMFLIPTDDWAAKAFYAVDPSMGTGVFFKDGVKVVTVPGNHITMLKEPHVAVLAQALEKCVKELLDSSNH